MTEISKIINNGFIELSFKYADFYKSNPKNFIRCFLKFNSIRLTCQSIVISYSQVGALQEIDQDFLEWTNKQNLSEKWKPVLNDILRIIYSISVA